MEAIIDSNIFYTCTIEKCTGFFIAKFKRKFQQKLLYFVRGKGKYKRKNFSKNYKTNPFPLNCDEN